jgi:hypothetical protein
LERRRLDTDENGGEMSRKQELAAKRLQQWKEDEIRTRAADAASKNWAKESEAAGELLLDPAFFPKLLLDIGKAGLVGETSNALATYIVATSRLREYPLNEILKGKSSAGKNHLAKMVLKFLPQDEVVSVSSMTKHALDYAGPDRLAHKVVYIDEHVGRTHPLRQLISEGRLIRWVTQMENGVRVMKERVTQGPISCITTTTENALSIDDENRNLSFWIDESYKQTQEISTAHVAKREPLLPERLRQWHIVQHRIADRKDVVIETPRWFVDIAKKILPYGDLRIRRYWPAFVEACKIVALIRAAARPKPDDEITVSFDDFATTLCIFDRPIGDSLTRSGGDAEMAIGELVERLSGGRANRAYGRWTKRTVHFVEQGTPEPYIS